MGYPEQPPRAPRPWRFLALAVAAAIGVVAYLGWRDADRFRRAKRGPGVVAGRAVEDWVADLEGSDAETRKKAVTVLPVICRQIEDFSHLHPRIRRFGDHSNLLMYPVEEIYFESSILVAARKDAIDLLLPRFAKIDDENETPLVIYARVLGRIGDTSVIRALLGFIDAASSKLIYATPAAAQALDMLTGHPTESKGYRGMQDSYWDPEEQRGAVLRARAWLRAHPEEMKRQRPGPLPAPVIGPAVPMLVDASKGATTWWFPQRAPRLDSGQPHQGAALAEFIHKRGFPVRELAPGGDLAAALTDSQVIIRPAALHPYTSAEVELYRARVAAGARLLLMGVPAGEQDALAMAFGLRFERRREWGYLQRWIEHPLTRKLDWVECAWIPLAQMPAGAVPLAWHDRGGPTPQVALGMLQHGKGWVIFCGAEVRPKEPPTAWLDTALDALSSGPSSPQTSSTVKAPALLGPPPPELLAPAAGATLPQPGAGEWHFDWADAPGATEYDVLVHGSAIEANGPFVKQRTKVSELRFSRPGAAISGDHVRGWTWQVRATANRNWGDWSPPREFSVTPIGLPGK